MSDMQQQHQPVAERAAVETLSFEQAQAELEQVVEALENRHTGLDDALALWERGEALHAWCQTRLDYAADRLKKLTVTAKSEVGPLLLPAASLPAPRCWEGCCCAAAAGGWDCCSP